jgi:hypothetical protein
MVPDAMMQQAKQKQSQSKAKPSSSRTTHEQKDHSHSASRRGREQERVKGEEERVVDDYHYQLLLGCLLSACSAVSLFCHVVRHRVASVIAACVL